MVERFSAKLPEGVTEEEATSYIREHLRHNNGLSVLEDFLHQLLMKQPKDYGTRSGVPAQYGFDYRSNTTIYHQVVWNLVNRGVFYVISRSLPKSVQLDHYSTGLGDTRRDLYLGPTFRLTPHGQDWLDEEEGVFNCLPTEYGRFSEFLSGYKDRFGDGYLARSREAVGCYKAKLYLATCVMCGAASESIILQIRIAQAQDEQAVINEYARKQGLEKVINSMTHNRQVQDLVIRMEDMRDLVKYWRNESAHGAPSTVGEVEAFTALLLLLRFAHFADDNWNALTE